MNSTCSADRLTPSVAREHNHHSHTEGTHMRISRCVAAALLAALAVTGCEPSHEDKGKDLAREACALAAQDRISDAGGKALEATTYDHSWTRLWWATNIIGDAVYGAGTLPQSGQIDRAFAALDAECAKANA
jgi:hypothetical protein